MSSLFAGSWVVRLVLLSLLVAVAAFLIWTFVWASWREGSAPAALPPEPEVVVPVEVAGTPVYMPALTREAEELRRLIDEHSQLLTSIPPTPLPTPTLTVEQSQGLVGFEVAMNPEGVPYPTLEPENWFDPELGIDFHRTEGGDWTGMEMRQSHPFRELFYYEGYADGVPNFHDRSIHGLLARRLAEEAAEVLPILASPSPSVLSLFARNIGWEIRDPARPVINLWTTFEYSAGQSLSVYAIGGVMALTVSGPGGSSSTGEDESQGASHLSPGQFMGPVVVQRLETERP